MCPEAGQAHYLVDDQLSDVEHRHRKQRPEETEKEIAGGESWARLPDQLQERRKVPQRAEPLGPRFRRMVTPAIRRSRHRAPSGAVVLRHAGEVCRGWATGARPDKDFIGAFGIAG